MVFTCVNSLALNRKTLVFVLLPSLVAATCSFAQGQLPSSIVRL